MTQFYIVEIKEYPNGEYEHEVSYAYDEDPDKARLKAESRYHEILSGAAVSQMASHGCIVFDTRCFPILNYCYEHR